MNELLTRLKIDIGITNSTVYDERLTSLLNASLETVNRFVGEQVDITQDRDAELVIDYARYLWLTRNAPADLPTNLKYRLNCRAFERNIPEG